MEINTAQLVHFQDDHELRDAVEACELVSADGQAVVWAAAALGRPLPERAAGIDLMHELIALARSILGGLPQACPAQLAGRYVVGTTRLTWLAARAVVHQRLLPCSAA
jgi:hypothetical protein